MWSIECSNGASSAGREVAVDPEEPSGFPEKRLRLVERLERAVERRRHSCARRFSSSAKVVTLVL